MEYPSNPSSVFHYIVKIPIDREPIDYFVDYEPVNGFWIIHYIDPTIGSYRGKFWYNKGEKVYRRVREHKEIHTTGVEDVQE